MESEKPTVTVADDMVVIKRPRSSRRFVAHVLGAETGDGCRHLVLDRLLHTPFEREFEGWRVFGAVVTEMTEIEH